MLIRYYNSWADLAAKKAGGVGPHTMSDFIWLLKFLETCIDPHYTLCSYCLDLSDIQLYPTSDEEDTNLFLKRLIMNLRTLNPKPMKFLKLSFAFKPTCFKTNCSAECVERLYVGLESWHT